MAPKEKNMAAPKKDEAKLGTRAKQVRPVTNTAHLVEYKAGRKVTKAVSIDGSWCVFVGKQTKPVSKHASKAFATRKARTLLIAA